MKRLVAVTVIAMLASLTMAQDQAKDNAGKQMKNRDGQGANEVGRGGGMHGGRGGGMMGGGMMGGGMGSAGMIERMLNNPKITEELGLTEENITALRMELETFKTKTDALGEEMKKAGMKQAELMTAKELDEAALMAAVEETGRIQTELGKLQIQKLLVIRKYVSFEAVQKIQTKARERMEQMMKSRQQGQGDQQGQGGKERRNREGGDQNPPPPPPDDGENMPPPAPEN